MEVLNHRQSIHGLMLEVASRPKEFDEVLGALQVGLDVMPHALGKVKELVGLVARLVVHPNKVCIVLVPWTIRSCQPVLGTEL